MNITPYDGNKTDFYFAPSGVADVVNLAIQLRRPLLVEGEPGCGKTMLAYSIAAELFANKPEKISVKSTTRARDLLYSVNALRRLQDAQNPQNDLARFIYPYISLGPLGGAIQSGTQGVVLIDEVDKADIDFPNDLLDVLENFTFQIEDLPPAEEELCKKENHFGRTVQGNPESSPIFIITSNREKRLPEPFLRRCLYVRLRFPDTSEELRTIVEKNISSAQVDRALSDAAIEAFRGVRALSVGKTEKPPSTSELLDWVRILHWRGVKPEQLSVESGLPPHWEVLFKTANDLDNFPALAQGQKT